MDFEAFRKKKKEQQDALKAAEADNNRPMANGQTADWIPGVGPAGVSNPKIKGFVLGRYAKKRVDPRTLHKPKGFESQSRRTSAGIARRVVCCNENVEPSVAIVLCHGCKKLYHPQCIMDDTEGVCCEGRAMLLAPPPRARSAKDIGEEISRMNLQRPKGIQKY